LRRRQFLRRDGGGGGSTVAIGLTRSSTFVDPGNAITVNCHRNQRGCELEPSFSGSVGTLEQPDFNVGDSYTAPASGTDAAVATINRDIHGSKPASLPHPGTRSESVAGSLSPTETPLKRIHEPGRSRRCGEKREIGDVLTSTWMGQRRWFEPWMSR